MSAPSPSPLGRLADALAREQIWSRALANETRSLRTELRLVWTLAALLAVLLLLEVWL